MNFIPNIVGSYKALFVCTLFLTILLFGLNVIDFGIQDNTTVWKGTCSFKGWNKRGDLGMVLDCGDHGEGTLENSVSLRSYLNNPGPLMCELSAAGNISCENRPPLEGEEG